MNKKIMVDKINYRLTDEQIKFILQKKEEGLDFSQIAELYNKHFAKVIAKNKSSEAIRSIYRRYQHEDVSPSVVADTIKTKISLQQRNAQLAKENKLIAANILTKEDVLESIESIAKKISYKKIKHKKIPNKKSYKKKMVIEAMFSDIHYGKKTSEFNLEVCRKRIVEYTRSILQEIEMNSQTFNVTEVILNFLGDIIESSTMHGMESLLSSQFGNSEQVKEAIESIIEDVLLPISEECEKRNIKLTFIGVPGNHDRTDSDKTFNFVGKNNLTWIIYNSVKLFAKHMKLNVTFYIAENSFFIYKIFNDYMLCEHYDLVKANTYNAMQNHLFKRSNQCGFVISFMRGGHFHNFTIYERGAIIVNGSVCGQDSYAENLGYKTEPIQVINLYCETQNRPTSFYKTFPVHLESK